MATDDPIQQQIVREAPEIEAYKLDLLKQARDLATQQGFADQIPGYQVAGFSPAQIAAMRAAEQQGVGAFSPYVTAANQGLAGAMTTTREAGDILRGADTRGQFTDAQAAMRQALRWLASVRPPQRPQWVRLPLQALPGRSRRGWPPSWLGPASAKRA